MAMDFKKLIYNNPYKAFYGILIIFGIVILALLVALWNKYAATSTNIAKTQIEIYNNYLLSINPNDTASIKNAPSRLFNSDNTPIEDVFLSIYDADGKLLYTNASTERNRSILSFKQIQEDFQNNPTKHNYYHIKFDNVIEKDCIISASFSTKYNRYIISECTINNTATLSGFLSEMSLKLTLILFIIIVAFACVHLLRKHTDNIDRLRKFIIHLSEEFSSMRLYDTKIQSRNNINGITEDLYTLFKKQIDIIKQHDNERELAILEEKEKMASKRALANNLNHEIKTPIGIIIGYLDTLINHPNIDESTRLSFLKKCLLNTQRLQNMVVNIAVLNRIEDGSNNIALEDINFYNVANHAKDDLKFTLNEYNMKLNIDIDPDIYVRSNEMLLYNIFCNLIKNSCFYSLGSDITLIVENTSDTLISFKFYDNGTGVPESALDKLFNRFYRIEKDKNKKSGTGLGLAIVKESITLCGGSISVNNRPESGLEFTFTLPIA